MDWISIGPLSYEGLKDIDHRDNLRFQGNLFPPQSVRIAGAVLSLVVMQHDIAQMLELSEASENARGYHRVLFHLGVLFGVELACLYDNARGHPDFPDIVQQCRDIQITEPLALKTKFLSYKKGKNRDVFSNGWLKIYLFARRDR